MLQRRFVLLSHVRTTAAAATIDRLQHAGLAPLVLFARPPSADQLAAWDRRLATDEAAGVDAWHRLNYLQLSLASRLTDVITAPTAEEAARIVVDCVRRHTNAFYSWVNMEHEQKSPPPSDSRNGTIDLYL